MSRERIDMTGRRLGRLVVLGVDPYDENRLLCRCDCGNLTSIKRTSASGQIKSCGCLRRETSSSIGKRVCSKNFSERRKLMKKYHTNNKVIGNCTKLAKNNTSGTNGVCKNNRTGKYHAYITMNYHQINLGTFNNINDAVEARKEAEEKYYKPLVEAVSCEINSVA